MLHPPDRALSQQLEARIAAFLHKPFGLHRWLHKVWGASCDLGVATDSMDDTQGIYEWHSRVCWQLDRKAVQLPLETSQCVLNKDEQLEHRFLLQSHPTWSLDRNKIHQGLTPPILFRFHFFGQRRTCMSGGLLMIPKGFTMQFLNDVM